MNEEEKQKLLAKLDEVNAKILKGTKRDKANWIETRSKATRRKIERLAKGQR